MATSKLHEAVVLLFRKCPSLAGTLLARAPGGHDLRFERASLSSEKAAPVYPSPLDCDAVVTLESGGRIVATVLVEVQLQKRSEKRLAWPAYVSFAYHQHGCPAHLLVVAIDVSVARWAAQPIHVGPPGFVLRPMVIGPDVLPPIFDPAEAARAPELAVLAALANPRSARAIEQGRALLTGLRRLDDRAAGVYLDVVLARLLPAARAALEAVMKSYEFQSDFAKKYVALGRTEGRNEGLAEGQAQAKADAVLAFLRARGLAVPKTVAARVCACRDVTELDRWVRRAAAVTRAADIFGE